MNKMSMFSPANPTVQTDLSPGDFTYKPNSLDSLVSRRLHLQTQHSRQTCPQTNSQAKSNSLDRLVPGRLHLQTQQSRLTCPHTSSYFFSPDIESETGWTEVVMDPGPVKSHDFIAHSLVFMQTPEYT